MAEELLEERTFGELSYRFTSKTITCLCIYQFRFIENKL